MTITLVGQTTVFGAAVLFGILFGALFDVFQCLGAFWAVRCVGQTILDCLAFLLCAVISYFYFLTFLNGALRLYSFCGMAIGVAVWRWSFGLLGRKFAQNIKKRGRALTVRLQKKLKANYLGKKAEKTTKNG